MNEDIDAPVGFGFTFTAPTYSYGDGTLYAHGTISMHIAAPKEPVVTTTPITTTKITTKVRPPLQLQYLQQRTSFRVKLQSLM